jgi:polysaccharide deacetylase 2 family uncharacterized protein YibQ
MIDQLPFLSHITVMLTTKNAPKPPAPARPFKPADQLAKDLQFASANQQMEGFPGRITEAVAAHQPNLRQITEDAKRFGAHIPTEENLKQPPIFKNWKPSRKST